MKRLLSMLLALACLSATIGYTPVFAEVPVDPWAEYTHTIFYDGFEEHHKQKLNGDKNITLFEVGGSAANSYEFNVYYTAGAGAAAVKKIENNTTVDKEIGPGTFLKHHSNGTTNRLIPRDLNFFGKSYPEYENWKEMKMTYEFYPEKITLEDGSDDPSYVTKRVFRLYFNGSNSNYVDIAYMNDDGTISTTTTEPRVSGEYDSFKSNDWNTLDFVLSLGTTKQCTAYLNGEPIGTKTLPVTLEGVHGFGFEDLSTKTDILYLDNLSCTTIPFTFKSCSIADKSTDVMLTREITLNFDREPALPSDGQITLEKTAGSDAITLTPTVEGNSIKLALDSEMEFETEYALTIKGDLADVDGSKLYAYKEYSRNDDKEYTIIADSYVPDTKITFTTMKEGVVAPVPVLDESTSAGTVKADVTLHNYTANNINAIMYAGVQNSDGKYIKLGCGSDVEIPSHAGAPLTATVTDVDPTDTVTFFPAEIKYTAGSRIDEITLLNKTENWLVATGAASASFAALSEPVPEPLTLTEPTPPDPDGNLSVTGRYTAGGSLLVYLKDESDNIAYAAPVVSGADGSFTVNFLFSAAGKFTIHARAFGTEDATGSYDCTGKIIYIDDARRDQILRAVNSSGSINALKDVFVGSGGCTEELMISPSICTDAAFQLLYEQRPYTTVDSAGGVKEKLEQYSAMLPNINASDWTKLKTLLASKAGVILNDKSSASSYDEYINDMDDSAKSRICQLAVRDEDFTTINEFRTAFAQAITDYKNEPKEDTEDDDSGDSGNSGNYYLGGGGGGGGGAYTPVPSVPSVPQNPIQPSQDFNDLTGYEWAHQAIYALRDAGIVSPDSSYRPGDAITREEYIKLVVMLMGIQVTNGNDAFADVDASAWYAPYIKAAKLAGIVTGQGDNIFGVGQQISRQDMMVMAYRALVNAGKIDPAAAGELPFTDADTVSDYARETVAAMYKLGIINGMDNGTIAPHDSANRAQAAKIIYGLLSLI